MSTDITRETIRRVTATLNDGDRLEYRAGPKTTLVVMKVVMEIDWNGGPTFGDIKRVDVYGYRKERPRRGDLKDGASHHDWFMNGTAPAELRPLVKQMREQ